MTRQDFEADSAAVRRARLFAIEAAGDLHPEDCEALAVMVSELAANCVRHAESAFRVVVRTTPDQVHVSVSDSGPGTPEMRMVGPEVASGRGLRIVDALSDSWGVEPDPDGGRGKTVWFTYATRPADPAAGARMGDTAAGSGQDRRSGADGGPASPRGDRDGQPRPTDGGTAHADDGPHADADLRLRT